MNASISFTFEYEVYAKGDPGFVECQITFNYWPGTPETGRGYMADPAKYDPGSGHEVEYLYAEREVATIGGGTKFERLTPDEFLDEQCRAYLESREECDLLDCLPERGEVE